MDPAELPSRLDPPRPSPPRSPLRELVDRARWFGVGRLVAAAISTALVVGGGWWLLSAPAPAPEATLPVATAGSAAPGSTPAVTLPPPTPLAAPATTGTPQPTEVVVHVAGAVAEPGVHRLPVGARVADAVAAAGGVAPGGDPDGLNLAAPLVDGGRVYVPLLGEIDPASVPAVPPGVGAAAGSPGGSIAPGEPVDVNVASAAELEELPGVGPSLAAAIVDDRTRNGPFASVDDLDRVSGIGPAKLAALRDSVTV